MPEPQQLVLEDVYLSQLGITREDWNLTRNLMIQPHYGAEPKLEDLTLRRVMEDPLLRQDMMTEVRTANFWYPKGITDSEREGKIELAEKLRREYALLRSEPPVDLGD
jgi:hypothetical protein